MTTGERIKACRKSRGMSAESLADKCKISPATIYRYENGDIEKVSIDKLKEIADALGVSAAYLLGWEVNSEVTTEDLSLMMDISEDIDSGRHQARTEMFNLFGADHFAFSSRLVGKDQVAILYYKAFERNAADEIQDLITQIQDLDYMTMTRLRYVLGAYLRATPEIQSIVDMALKPYQIPDECGGGCGDRVIVVDFRQARG